MNWLILSALVISCYVTIVSSMDETIGIDLLHHETCAGGKVKRRDRRPTRPTRPPRVTKQRRGGRTNSGRRQPRAAGQKAWRWNKKIEFPNFTLNNSAQLEEDDESNGCYRIKGDIKVYQQLRNNMQFFITLNNKAAPDVSPMPCTGYDKKTGCGGFGSCLYCNTCEEIKSNKVVAAARARIERSGKPLDCNDKLQRGVHRDVTLHFCLPSKKEFLRLLGIEEKIFDKLIKTQSNGQTHRRSVFITVYLFEFKASKTLKRTYDLEQVVRSNLKLKENDRLPIDTWNNLPFYRLVGVDGRGFVGCHRIFGNIVLSKKPTKHNQPTPLNRLSPGGG